jgi:hypothetical protein
MATTMRPLLVIAIVLASTGVSTRERLEMRARPAFAFAPSDVQMEFSIVPDAANRALEVSAESDDFFRSSVMELDGERAPRVISIRYRGLPAGDYHLRGSLVSDEGHEVAVIEKSVTVMMSGGEH